MMEAPALTLPQLSVACPACGSAASRLCTSHSGSRSRRDTVHQERRAAWGALQTEKAKARAAHVAAPTPTPVEVPPVDTIEHGTTRGYEQHRRRKVPQCQPCRDALNAQNRERRAARQGWNGGLAGTPKAPAPVPTGRDCPVLGCGELASTPQPAASMVHVVWPFSREPGRWYCPGACQAYGLALAEVRAIGDRDA
ncbi:zinc finger domain-containing protein [Streptomyces sp. Qhu_M48]|uniref:zinc finger domain-containing protein n=1 Tax=Streptomyces sp. Qhu_M48 TaxID=3435889 RepID=UPI003F4FA883